MGGGGKRGGKEGFSLPAESLEEEEGRWWRYGRKWGAHLGTSVPFVSTVCSAHFLSGEERGGGGARGQGELSAPSAMLDKNNKSVKVFRTTLFALSRHIFSPLRDRITHMNII